MKLSLRDDLVDAGLTWLGAIPQTWQVRRLGHYFEERREKVSDKDFSPLSVTMKGIVTQLENVAKTDDGDNRKLVRSGDFVINSRSDRKGSGGIAPQDGSVSLINIVLEPQAGINPRFASYLLTSHPFQEEFYRVGNGIVADMWTTKYSEMKNIRLAIPNEDEQFSIVAYLDRATARIDTLMAKKVRFIELLREKRQAIITNALTKGLHASAPLKDSGLSWLGMVPKSWRVMPIKRALNRNDGGVWGDDPTGTNDTMVLRSTDQSSDGFWTITDPAYRKLTSSEKASSTLKEGDLLVTKSSGSSTHIGKTTLVSADIAAMECCYSNFMQRLQMNDKVKPKFAWYFFNNEIARRQLDLASKSTTGLANLNSTILGEIWIAVPELGEQDKIIDFLERATAYIDNLISKSERSIGLLRERRTALIATAVTGKIDLRNTA